MVYRFFQCQKFGHLSRLCPIPIHYTNCSLEHIDKVFPNTSECINGFTHNNRFGTSFSPAHQSSYSECPCFKLAYQKERFFLYNKFQISNNYNSPIIVPALQRVLSTLYPLSLLLHGLVIILSFHQSLPWPTTVDFIFSFNLVMLILSSKFSTGHHYWNIESILSY